MEIAIDALFDNMACSICINNIIYMTRLKSYDPLTSFGKGFLKGPFLVFQAKKRHCDISK